MMPGKLAQTLEFRQGAVTHLGLDVRGTAGAGVGRRNRVTLAGFLGHKPLCR